MKPYFAKYLAIEGEIKDNDTILFAKRTLVEMKTKSQVEFFERVRSMGNHPKVKLFLCSRDIKIGDKLTGLSGVSTSEVKEYEILPFKDIGIHNQWFKVIGEISPKAIWVKEGDEFDEDEISGSAFIKMSNVIRSDSKVFIRCSKCNHFH